MSKLLHVGLFFLSLVIGVIIGGTVVSNPFTGVGIGIILFIILEVVVYVVDYTRSSTLDKVKQMNYVDSCKIAGICHICSTKLTEEEKAGNYQIHDCNQVLEERKKQRGIDEYG